MLEFVVMVAAYKIVHGFINLLVLYHLDMMWMDKNGNCKISVPGSQHYQSEIV
jgi:hypothetical protein